MSSVQLQRAPLHTLLPSHEDISRLKKPSYRSYMDNQNSSTGLPPSSTPTVDDPFQGLLAQDFTFPSSAFNTTPFIKLPNPRPQLQPKPREQESSQIEQIQPHPQSQPQKRKRSPEEDLPMPSSSRPRLSSYSSRPDSSYESRPITSYSSQYESPQGHIRSDLMNSYEHFPASSSVQMDPTYEMGYTQPQVGIVPSQTSNNTSAPISMPLGRSRNAWSEGAWSMSPRMSEATNVMPGMGGATTSYANYGGMHPASTWQPSHSHSMSYGNMLPSMNQGSMDLYGYGQGLPATPARARGASYPLAPTSNYTHQRSKPQCWDHGCNGREFSTFSNLLRHQREKEKKATKHYCPRCGAEFTRSTARTNHLLQDKCKSRPASEGDQPQTF